jgi:peptidoglycan/LPS O-acetylase OafA/YrhL
LRALAVGGVVAYHFGLTALPGGFAGVDIFFVISGWLISTHLMQEIGETGRLDLWRFYARRARRLLPAALFVILVTLAAGYFILAPQEQALYSRGAMFASAYAINLWLLRWSFDYFAADATANPFIHFWSLSVEEQFYLAWPALLLLAAWLRPGRRTAAAVIGVVGLASFAACLWLTSAAPAWAFYFSPLRAWEFAAGGLATLVPMALLQHRIWLRAALGWLGLALIATAYLLLSEDLPFPGWYALLPVAGTVLVLLGGAGGEQTNGRVNRHALGPATALSMPPLQWIGTLSYSLYLWHWPVIVYAGMLAPDLSVPQRLGCGVLALALSVLTYHLIENPARRGAWPTVGARAFPKVIPGAKPLRAFPGLVLVPALALTGAGVAVAYANAHLARAARHRAGGRKTFHRARRRQELPGRLPNGDAETLHVRPGRRHPHHRAFRRFARRPLVDTADRSSQPQRHKSGHLSQIIVPRLPALHLQHGAEARLHRMRRLARAGHIGDHPPQAAPGGDLRIFHRQSDPRPARRRTHRRSSALAGRPALDLAGLQPGRCRDGCYPRHADQRQLRRLLRGAHPVVARSPLAALRHAKGRSRQRQHRRRRARRGDQRARHPLHRPHQPILRPDHLPRRHIRPAGVS